MRIFLALFAALFVSATPQDDEPRFTSVEIWIDGVHAPLDAWQLELVDPDQRAKIVGVEGGEGAWQKPPAYDPRALQGGTIKLAAYTLDGAVSGRQRVARLHLAVEGSAPVEFEARLTACASGAERMEKAWLEITQ